MVYGLLADDGPLVRPLQHLLEVLLAFLLGLFLLAHPLEEDFFQALGSDGVPLALDASIPKPGPGLPLLHCLC